MTYLLADAPQPSWAGIITAMASLFTALALVITATGVALTQRRASKRADARQQETTARLDIIHTLVNSTLTAALQAQLDALRRELVMLIEMTDMQQGSGLVPTEERVNAITAARRRIAELTVRMMEREDLDRATQAALEPPTPTTDPEK